MEFARIDAHNWTYRYLSYSQLFFLTDLLTVFLVHLLNFPKVHPSTKDVVVELISMCYSG